jgi:hypothetical protein
MARRLEHVRKLTGYERNLRAFWLTLGGREGTGVSYESARYYHFDREASASYLARVVAVFPAIDFEWLGTGVGEPTKGARFEKDWAERADSLKGGVKELARVLDAPNLATVAATVAMRTLARLSLALVELPTNNAAEGGRVGDELARRLAACIRAPIDLFEVRQDAFNQAQWEDYIVAVCLALEAMLRAPRLDRRNAADYLRHEGKGGTDAEA